MTRASVLIAATLAFLICACPLASAQTPLKVSLRAGFTPEQLGAGTTMTFGFTIRTPPRQEPSPLTDVVLLYPSNLGLVTSGLGLAVCHPGTLEALGPEGCPVNSLMGYGRALAEIPIGPDPLYETAGITLLLGPAQNNHLALLFYAEGVSPISAQLVLPSLLLTANTPYGGQIDTNLPLVPSIPEAPDVAILSLHTTIGPSHITYYNHTHGHWIGFRPKGIQLPHHCPHGGFPFAAKFSFQDGSHAKAHTTVPCPRGGDHRR